MLGSFECGDEVVGWRVLDVASEGALYRLPSASRLDIPSHHKHNQHEDTPANTRRSCNQHDPLLTVPKRG